MNVIIDGLLVNYVEQGSGPTLVLLHGWGVELKTFDQLATSLQANYSVVRLDFPGFGQSERPKTDWDVQAYAEFLKAFLNKIGIAEPDFLVGHSFGGRVIIKAVGTGLLVPKKIVLLASAGVQEPKSVRNKSFGMVAKVGKAVTRLPGLSSLQNGLRKKLYQAAGSTDYLSAGPMKSIFQKVISEDLRPDAAHIQVPTQMIWGEDDETTPVVQAKLLQSKIQVSHLTVIPGAGHFVYVDAQKKVQELITDFLI